MAAKRKSHPIKIASQEFLYSRPHPLLGSPGVGCGLHLAAERPPTSEPEELYPDRGEEEDERLEASPPLPYMLHSLMPDR
jgi:hypothetical protein